MVVTSVYKAKFPTHSSLSFSLEQIYVFTLSRFCGGSFTTVALGDAQQKSENGNERTNKDKHTIHLFSFLIFLDPFFVLVAFSFAPLSLSLSLRLLKPKSHRRLR